MQQGGGKRKGSSFERKIAKELSLWITEGETERVFWRTHSSGALGTVWQGGRLEFGDIMSIDDRGKALTDRYNLELRHSRSLNVADLLYGSDKSGMAKFIKEGRHNAEMSSRKPLWIFREHLHESMVMFDSSSPWSYDAVFPRYKVAVISFERWKKVTRRVDL